MLMKKFVFCYLFIGLLVLFMLVSTSSAVSTSSTVTEYGAFPFVGPVISQGEHDNWCAFACFEMLIAAKGITPYKAMCEIASLHVRLFYYQICDCCDNKVYSSGGPCVAGLKRTNIPTLASQVGLRGMYYWIGIPAALTNASPENVDLPKMALVNRDSTHAIVVYYIVKMMEDDWHGEILVYYIDPQGGMAWVDRGGDSIFIDGTI